MGDFKVLKQMQMWTQTFKCTFRQALKCLYFGVIQEFPLIVRMLLMEWNLEDITWPRGDTTFLFECWKIFHEWAQRTNEIFSTRAI